MAHDAVERLIASRDMAVVHIDTRLDQNSRGLRTPSEIESLIARMDVVVTTRMHGMVLALKNGVPAVVIDSVAGGAKITRQAKAIGWPCVMGVEALTDGAVAEAFAYCLTLNARDKAKECSDAARRAVEEVRRQFKQALAQPLDSGQV
jgi:polysaccharide pyruvyl transferase WcaK-like protein